MARRKEGQVVPLYRPRKCAVCGKPTVREFHPFCSKRCADVDLGKWLSGSYAIPAVETDPAVDEGSGNGEE
jgi:endogenous inhibitor of DNA gyrase (YacG/DUF329 family)